MPGARIATYPDLSYVPLSRFTLIRHGRQDTEVAIGRRIRGVHTIETFGPGIHPAFALAEDLVEFVLRHSGVRGA